MSPKPPKEEIHFDIDQKRYHNNPQRNRPMLVLNGCSKFQYFTFDDISIT